MSEIKIKCPTCGKVLCLQEAPNIYGAQNETYMSRSAEK